MGRKTGSQRRNAGKSKVKQSADKEAAAAPVLTKDDIYADNVIKETESLITAKPKPAAPEKLPSGLRYPYSTIDNTQDFLKFTIFKYKRSGVITRDSNSLKADLIGNIILPIPASLADSNNADWGQSNMNFMQAAGVQLGSDMMEGKMEDAGKGVNSMVAKLKGNPLVKQYFAAQAVNSIAGNMSVDQVMARGSGQVLNPNMELLFKGPALRSFSYQFRFTPRFQKEAETIRTIIKAFKRNMAPESASGGANLKTPKVFEIQYLGKAQDYLNRIKLCALKTCAVNYTADGTWATYNDGAPIAMTMDLSFTELTPVYSEDYKGYNDSSDGVGF